MNAKDNLLDVVARRRARYTIGAVAAAAVAVGATPAAAQYGTDAPLPPLPPLQGATVTPPPATRAPGASVAPAPAPSPSTPSPSSARATTPAPNRSGVAGAGSSGNAAPAGQGGVAGAVGSGDVVPATGTAGEVRDTGVGAPAVRIVSTERAEPVTISGDDLPFTGANLTLLALIGGALLALGLGVRRRSMIRTAKP